MYPVRVSKRSLVTSLAAMTMATIPLMGNAASATATPAADATPAPRGAIRDLAGCTAQTLPRNDDSSTGQVTLPFTANFFGKTYSSLYVNNNGNVTFDSPQSTYTPYQLINTGRVIIAPFFGDVDTTSENSLETHYGNTTVNGRNALCVNWVQVGYFSNHADKLNSFQLLLIDRSDVKAGDFDIEFNYNQIQWETGDASQGSGGIGGSPARVGFSNGKDHAFELPGSGQTGAFLDSNATTGLRYTKRQSSTPGQLIFPVRGGDNDAEIREIPLPTFTVTPVEGVHNDIITVDPEWLATWGDKVTIFPNSLLFQGGTDGDVAKPAGRILPQYRNKYIWAGSSASGWDRWMLYPGRVTPIYDGDSPK
ncbi:hypothetical protein KEM60_01127 [Austwickia sp. TVS 96-490-7B]|uniref:nidogen-like domain-containing protein n=1 Tax=Austwickia sp. TVS 96-490-7B TaxID=2830843 RepID=UPI001C5A343F|nr:nidogen-like domain-containing protein [Austwickia sp. TVS 96-490-7B]MBW3084936.1 hypothetical protein [Austwickia sp. TVS 96-490-7B]